MEITNVEVNAIERTTEQATATALQELSESQLTLVGGGIGDVVFI
jgi:hypothetical protein